MPIAWFQGTPTEAGIYLRRNPGIHAVVRQDVVDLTGQLYCIHDGQLTPIERLSKTFWWFGPIPLPPKWEEASDGASQG